VASKLDSLQNTPPPERATNENLKGKGIVAPGGLTLKFANENKSGFAANKPLLSERLAPREQKDRAISTMTAPAGIPAVDREPEMSGPSTPAS